ncbi:MAG: PQQ-binding-like beta-propeller repeat protein [Pirellulales bacterium]|nr:PQQ-binding-like beta-propeller repeat protein [Pirellulales bacterium]
MAPQFVSNKRNAPPSKEPRSPLAACLAMAVVLSCLPAVTVRADDWPQWRGPERDGVWRETGIIESFPAEGLQVCWRAPVGPGFSSPVVAQGRVYLIHSQLMPPNAKECVQCLDAATGRPLWTNSYDVGYPDWAFTPEPGMGPAATPIVANKKLYTLGDKGDLICFDALKGDVLWQRNLEKEYGVEQFCFNASPLLEGGLLVLCIGSYGGASPSWVLALDKDSGKEAWKVPNAGLTNSSPIAITAAGKRQVIVWTQKSIASLDPATGKTFWEEPMNTMAQNAVATPVFHEDLLLVSGLMLKLDSEKPAAAVLWPETKASSRRILSNTSTPVFLDSHVFSARLSGEFVCLEARTGKQVWKTDKVTELRNGTSVHVTPNGDAALLFTDKGDLIRAQLTSTGYKEISRARLVEPTYPYAGRKVVWPPPAYADRRVFARNDKELICASLACATPGGVTDASGRMNRFDGAVASCGPVPLYWLRRERVRCFLWMPRTSSWDRSWDGCGVRLVSLCVPRRAANGTTCWER